MDDGRIGDVSIAGAVAGLSVNVSNGDIRSLVLGDVSDATVSAPLGALLGIRAEEWDAGAISAEWVKSVVITGDSLLAVRGDFGADITSTDPNARLNTLSVAG